MHVLRWTDKTRIYIHMLFQIRFDVVLIFIMVSKPVSSDHFKISCMSELSEEVAYTSLLKDFVSLGRQGRDGLTPK